MFFLLILACATAAAAGVLAVRRRFSSRQAARAGMAVAMVVAGVSHLAMPTPFIQHLPEWVPAREAIVAGTGLMEIALGAGLLLRQPLRRTAGLLLAAYLVLVLPGNVYVAVAGVDVDGQPGGMYPWLRLPLQALFVAWAIWCTDNPGPTADAGDGRGSGRHKARQEDGVSG